MKDNDEVDFKKILNFLKRITLKDIIILWLIVMMVLFFMFHTSEIDRCQDHYNKMLNDKEFLIDTLGIITLGANEYINMPIRFNISTIK